MNNILTTRSALTLMSAVLLIFSLMPNPPANAQGQDSCKDQEAGWTLIDASLVDLSGDWTVFQNKNCGSNMWQYSAPVSITEENGGYSAICKSDNSKMTVSIGGSGVVIRRDLTTGSGPKLDKNKQTSQTWRGTLEKNRDGRLRIYGTWSGAYDYIAAEYKNNLDFKLTRGR